MEAENRRRRGTLLVEDGCNTCLTGDVWRSGTGTWGLGRLHVRGRCLGRVGLDSLGRVGRWMVFCLR